LENIISRADIYIFIYLILYISENFPASNTRADTVYQITPLLITIGRRLYTHPCRIRMDQKG